MKILIVNAYPKTSKGEASFLHFYGIIKEIFAKQSVFFDASFDFVIRNGDNLDEFLYDEQNSYVQKNAAKAFDHLDMIFVEGDVNVLPWSSKMSKVLILLSMCIKAKKVLFASAFAMQALVYLTATNIETPINIINGNGRGGKIEEVNDLNINISSIKHNDYYLDRITGDAYSLNYDTKEWVPKMNTGIHHRRSAIDPHSQGKCVLKPSSNTRDIFKQNATGFCSSDTEDFCNVKKLYSQHYSLTDVPSEFVIPAKNLWDIHRFNFVNPYKTFIVLAESHRTPQIIFFEGNCIATLFDITKKYPTTVKIITSFIYARLTEIKNDDSHKGLEIENAAELFRRMPNNYFKLSSRAQAQHCADMKGTNKISVIKDKATSLIESVVRPNTNKIYHVGYTFTRHHEAPLIVDNNTVRKDITVKVTDPKKKERSFLIRSSRASEREQKTTDVQSMPNLDDISDKCKSEFQLNSLYTPKIFLTGSHQSSRNQSTIDSTKQSHRSIISKAKVSSSLSSLDQPLKHDRPSSQQHSLQDLDFEVDSNLRTRADLATIVYPELDEDALHEKEVWVPGQLTQRLRSKTVNNGQKTVRLNTSSSTRFFSNYNKFKGIDLDEGRSRPCIRTSSEYITEHERLQKEEKENDKNIIGSKFLRFGGKATKPNYIPNYVNQPISDPVITYEHREINPDKWIAGKMKFY